MGKQVSSARSSLHATHLLIERNVAQLAFIVQLGLVSLPGLMARILYAHPDVMEMLTMGSNCEFCFLRLMIRL